MYDLLKYDKVVIINDEKYLYSCFYINLYAEIHLKAYDELEISYKQKPQNTNIDTATNKSKDIKGKVAFLNPMFKPAIENEFADSKSEELKLSFIENYENEYRIIARSIYELAKLKEYSDNFEINAIGSLEPFVNSDGHITNNDLYISWYAYVFTIYKHDETPVTNKLKLAQLSSYVIFPKLRGIGKCVSLYYGRPSKALQYANSYGFNNVVMVGEKEVKKEKFKVKDMKTGKESVLKI